MKRRDKRGNMEGLGQVRYTVGREYVLRAGKRRYEVSGVEEKRAKRALEKAGKKRKKKRTKRESRTKEKRRKRKEKRKKWRLRN